MNEHVIIQAKHQFTEHERKELGELLAKKSIEKSEAQEAKKLAAARFKERIDTIQNVISTAAFNLSNGYEYRDYKCSISFDYKKKKKTYTEIGTGSVIDIRDFAPEDYQRPLPLGDHEGTENKRKEKPRSDLDN